MENKLRQLTDAIHQTIYLSELESKMMSTAYFYRLHDVYQSSTVYLAFPCNRTKRYEHSCGTMDIAGKMFFYSVANADDNVLTALFEKAETEFCSIIRELLKAKRRTIPAYLNTSITELSQCFKPVSRQRIDEQIQPICKTTYDNYDLVRDSALNHYMPPFSLASNKNRFLYQCILEAIRIVALFHDIGHPPYSHIMETVLKNLYERCKEDQSQKTNQFNKEKAEILIESLEPYHSVTTDNVPSLLTDSKSINSPLHEQVGLQMLNLAFDDILKERIVAFNNDESYDTRGTLAAYYITVAEFCICIIRESNPFFKSLHRFIDGTIDADRLDYVARDTLNSGVDWGKVSYRRLLESCKLTKTDGSTQESFHIAFPEKMSDDIDDIIKLRYKIYSRINYHHKAYKTSLILQRLVYLLALDYLRKDSTQKALCPQISDLWCCLYNTLSSYNLYIIQWNDSTLISHLYQTLADCKPASHKDYQLQEEEYTEILHMLEEFLLNQKHFIPIFKRQSDFSSILENVFSRFLQSLDTTNNYERRALLANSKDKNAAESLLRLDRARLDSMIKSGDIDGIVKIFPIKRSIKDIITEVLNKNKSESALFVYLLDENNSWKNLGIPLNYGEDNGIFLYTANSEKPKLYDVSGLKKQLVQLQNKHLHYIAYIETEKNSDSIIDKIKEEIQNMLFEELDLCLTELFPIVKNDKK